MLPSCHSQIFIVPPAALAMGARELTLCCSRAVMGSQNVHKRPDEMGAFDILSPWCLCLLTMSHCEEGRWIGKARSHSTG